MSVRACTLEEDASTQDHRCVQAEAPQYSIASNEDVLFYWSMLSTDADEEDTQTLLKMVIKLQTTICALHLPAPGLNYINKPPKKTIQRSKALHRKCTGLMYLHAP